MVGSWLVHGWFMGSAGSAGAQVKPGLFETCKEINVINNGTVRQPVFILPLDLKAFCVTFKWETLKGLL